MKTKLSDRVRPNSEAAPWVIDEIKKLEAELASDHCPHGVYWHACGDPKCANIDEKINEQMHLTKEQLLVMLKNAYLRGAWEHVEQRTKTRVNMNGPYRKLNIPDFIVEDLITEE